jgi:hypothetical protein
MRGYPAAGGGDSREGVSELLRERIVSPMLLGSSFWYRTPPSQYWIRAGELSQGTQGAKAPVEKGRRPILSIFLRLSKIRAPPVILHQGYNSGARLRSLQL